MFGGEPYAGCVIVQHCTHCVGSPALTVIVASFILPHCDEAETLTFTFLQISPYVCVYRQRYRAENVNANKQWDRWGKGQYGKDDKQKDVRLTLGGDLARANEVALIPDEDDGGLGLSLPQEKPELSGAVETTPVGHWKHQDTHLTQQSRQVLRDTQRPYSGWYLNIYCGWGARTDSINCSHKYCCQSFLCRITVEVLPAENNSSIWNPLWLSEKLLQ